MKRWWTIPLSGILFLLMIVVVIGLHSRRVRAREWCGLDDNTPRIERIRSVDADWTWRPPGYDCVYSDGAGNEVTRRRAYPP
jgi:hypothetical protein